MEKMLTKPFFCIIYAQFKAEPKSWAKNEIDLVAKFVRKALLTFAPKVSDIKNDLSLIAAKAIDRNLGDVHISEIRLSSNINDILNTGFVSQQGEYICFTLPIIAQWMASEAIRNNLTRIDDILVDKAKIEKWIYPLSILFSQMTFEESLDSFSKIVHSAPGIASRIIRDGISFGQTQVLSTAYECGKKLQRCMQVWIDGLGALSKYIAPMDGSSKCPLAICAGDNWITYSWIKTDSDEDVILISKDEMMRFRGIIYSCGVPSQSTWPWIITFDYLSRTLEKAIKYHSIALENGQLREELFWNISLHLANKGGLYEGTIDFKSFEKYRKFIGHTLTVNRLHIDITSFFNIVNSKISCGYMEISPPYPTSDKKVFDRGGWVWSSYSEKRYLEKVRFTYNSALEEYMNLINSVFYNFKDCLRIAQLVPCRIVGGLVFNEGGEKFEDAPYLTWYIEALSPKENSYVDIQLRDIPIGDNDLYEAIANNNMRLRPELANQSPMTITQQVLRICSSTPVTDLVYEWLKKELKAIGWIEH